MNPLKPVLCEILSRHKGVVNHGFFTRKGGVSKGMYESLNVGLGSDDDQEKVLENRSRVASHFGATSGLLVTPNQVHSSRATVISAPVGETRPRVDGIATTNPKLVIGILTADCGPVLFCDPKNRVIAACHAGWKGATSGILESTVLEMESLGAERSEIQATLGPTISQNNYEVGPDFAERLLELDKGNRTYLVSSTKPGHQLFDLPGYIVNKLLTSGVSAHWTGHCTYADEERFFSYRRTTHDHEPDYGRQISAISLSS
ncbi:MAG: peptidoglycan editing factor PgeF [Rhizobiaceae bacterium]